MATEKFTLSKPIGLLIIALLGAAFFAGTRAKEIAATGQAQAAPRETPELTAAAVVATPSPVIEAVTAEQVRRLMLDMHDLQIKLEETIKQVGQLNDRLIRIEAAQH